MADMQRDDGEPEAVRRKDGGGETSPLPGSEAARGNEAPSGAAAGHGVRAEEWTPGTGNRGVRPGSPSAEATAGATGSGAGAGGGGGPEEYDSDPQGGGGTMPHSASSEAHPESGADAPSHGSR